MISKRKQKKKKRGVTKKFFDSCRLNVDFFETFERLKIELSPVFERVKVYEYQGSGKTEK